MGARERAGEKAVKPDVRVWRVRVISVLPEANQANVTALRGAAARALAIPALFRGSARL